MTAAAPTAPTAPRPGDRIAELLARRTAANHAFFAAEAGRAARLCHRMAERFARGGRLLAFGASPQARSDVRHVAVEFVHPVIVGKRALPALGVAPEGGGLAAQVALAARAEDVALAFGLEEPGGAAAEARAALTAARRRGCLTVAFAPGDADWTFDPAGVPGAAAGAADPFVRQELVETLYHLLWELVHVFLEHQGLLAGRPERRRHDAGAAAFLYPFLGEQERDLDKVAADVAHSVRMKAGEVGALREQTLEEGREALWAAAAAVRGALDAGGTLLAFGNGGSATDAMDLAADLRFPPAGCGWPARAALDLGEDPAILTALANDVGAEVLFARQVIAYGRPGDVAVGFSTSGGSGNVLAALAEARRRGLVTVAFTGYDGGRVAAEGLADHVVISRSEHVPRIQEAQASAYHVLRELIELAESPA